MAVEWEKKTFHITKRWEKKNGCTLHARTQAMAMNPWHYNSKNFEMFYGQCLERQKLSIKEWIYDCKM